MSETILIDQPALQDVVLPPTQDELPCCDGIPMETQRHQLQMEFLKNQLLPWLAQREDGYVGGNMFIYFSLAQVRNQDFRGSDFFAVLGVPKKERKSWVVWEEGKAPDVVIELLSDSTAERDKTEKKQIYQMREFYCQRPLSKPSNRHSKSVSEPNKLSRGHSKQNFGQRN
jgi:Uma2 family endonuclease